ncbi:hypothetical protein AB0A74_24765 [Saccharothrix sp. NPDC042600]|uniref:hypothetical protein n=1 Tax=Saccharothrix TaxID=2071 RepID=UPI0033C886CF|nr:hypothetical protein GCM10017745_18030 [Saccharothrix mutabilis subsp. capreolus]
MNAHEITNAGIDTEPTADQIAAIDASGVLTALDAEFHHLISHPSLSAELAEIRRAQPVRTTALLDGSARAARDLRIAERTRENAARVLAMHHTVTSVRAVGEAA